MKTISDQKQEQSFKLINADNEDSLDASIKSYTKITIQNDSFKIKACGYGSGCATTSS